MPDRTQAAGGAFFCLIDQGDQHGHGFVRDQRNLLVNGGNRVDGLPGDGGVVKADQPVRVGKRIVFPDKMVQERVRSGII